MFEYNRLIFSVPSVRHLGDRRNALSPSPTSAPKPGLRDEDVTPQHISTARRMANG